MAAPSTPDELSQTLCAAIADGDLSRVKELCDKRQQQSEDGTLGFFTVATNNHLCFCLPVPPFLFYGSYSGFTAWDDTEYGVYIAEFGKPPMLRELICAGKCVCRRRHRDIERKISPLVVACYYGHLEIVRHLLEVDRSVININTCMTPFMFTVICRNKRDRFEIANLLLQSGADVNITDKRSKVHALELAVATDDIEMVSFLLRNGVDVNSLKESPLPLSNSESCRRLLLNAGAKVLAREKYRCPFFRAMSPTSLDTLRDYTNSPHFEKNHEYSDARVTLIGSVGLWCDNRLEEHGLKVVDFLLQQEIHVDSNVRSEITQHHLRQFSELCWKGVWSDGPATFGVIAYSCPKVLSYLLQRGANVNFKNNFGVTTLMMFALNSAFSLLESESEISEHRSCLSMLLQHGVDLNARDIFGRTAIHYAVAKDERDQFPLERLLELNVDLRDQDASTTPYNWDKSAFYLACRFGQFAKARLLIDHGYNVRKETWLMKSELIPHDLRQNVTALEEFLACFQNPETLKCLCRNAIRSLLGVEIVVTLKQLTLPCILKDYLLFK